MSPDSYLLEILNSKFVAAADQMSFTLKRTGRTLYVKETEDYATGLIDLDGQVFASPRSTGVSNYTSLNCLPSIRTVGELHDGDVILTNHPYASQGLATHTPDLHMIRPYFHDGKVVCYGWCFIHATDVGGRVPSSISPTSTEIYQEGFLIPPLKLVEKGRINGHMTALLSANSRTGEDNLGDIKAMLAALATGGEKVAEIIAQHGADGFRNGQSAVLAYAEAKALAVLRRIPEGSYEFWDYLDDDGLSRVPVRIRLRLTVKDGRVDLDFSGTDPQVEGAFNLPTAGWLHPWLALRLASFICSYDTSVVLNAGLYRPFTTTVPGGSILNPKAPAATGVRHATASRINDVVNGALIKAVPDLLPAPASGVIVPIVLVEPATPTKPMNVLVVEPLVGGGGASRGQDGIDGRDIGIANLGNNPIETVEAACDTIVRRYGMRADSGGPGERRGGCGLMIAFEITRDGSMVMGRGMERCRFQPWGVAGGEPSTPAGVSIRRRDGTVEHYGKIDVLDVNAGDIVTVMTPGGGGYGDPFRRDPHAVLSDVRRGLVSVEAARRDYGVAIADGAVDAVATATLRAARPLREDGARIDFGPERRRWDEVFADEAVTRLNDGLARFSGVVGRRRRREIYEEIMSALPEAGSDDAAAIARLRGDLSRAIETL